MKNLLYVTVVYDHKPRHLPATYHHWQPVLVHCRTKAFSSSTYLCPVCVASSVSLDWFSDIWSFHLVLCHVFRLRLSPSGCHSIDLTVYCYCLFIKESKESKHQVLSWHAAFRGLISTPNNTNHFEQQLVYSKAVYGIMRRDERKSSKHPHSFKLPVDWAGDFGE